MRTLLLLFLSGLSFSLKSQTPCIEADTPLISASDTIICYGQNTFLSVDSGNLNDAFYWAWRKDSCNGTLLDTVPGIYVAPTQTTTYFVKGEGGCTQQTVCAMITIIVHSNPNASIMGPDSVCYLQPFELYVNQGPYNLEWSNGSTDTLITLAAGQTSNYFLNVLDTLTQCSNTVPFNVYVYPNQTAYIYGQTQICAGDVDTLYAQGFLYYQWSNGETDSMIVVNPTSSTLYSLLATDTNFCQTFSVLNVNVLTNPVVSITGDPIICQGEGSNLVASSAEFYQWSNGESSQSITVFPMNNSTYYVTATNNSGCQSIGSFSVNTLAVPLLITSADTVLCEQDSLIIWASGGDLYAWNNGDSNATQWIYPDTVTSYIVTATSSATQCSSIDTIIVSVFSKPMLSILSDSVYCTSDTLTLIAQGAQDYLWSTGYTGDTLTTQYMEFIQTYYVTGTDSNGCANTDSVAIEFIIAPELSFSGNNGLCPGDTTMIEVDGAHDYIWFDGTLDSLVTLSPLETFYATVIGVDAITGCRSKDSLQLIVYPSPMLSISGDTVLCQGESTTLQASGAISYNWSTGSIYDTTQIQNPLESISIVLSGSSSFGCHNTDTFLLTVYPSPISEIVLLEDTLCVFDANLSLTALPAGGDFSGTAVFTNTFLPAIAGPGFHTITYDYYNTYGCHDQDTAVILVETCVGIEELPSESPFQVYPNPGTDKLWIEYLDASPAQISIYNILGEELTQMNILLGKNVLDVSNFSNGTYYIHLRSDSRYWKQTYIIAR